jgi:hypothetical protein
LDSGAVVSDVAGYHGDLVAYGALGVPGCDMIARWNGTSWAPFGAGLGTWDLQGADGAIAVFGGDLYSGGNIGSADGNPSSFIARWMEPDPTAAPLLTAVGGAWSVRPVRTPARDAVRFEIVAARASELSLTIVDAAGRMIRRLAAPRVPAGTQFMTWDGRASHGGPAPAGVYFVRLTADDETKAGGKVVFVR